MKKLVLTLAIILICASAVEAAGPRTLTKIVEADAIENLDLSSGIGDVTIIARQGLDEVAIEVVLTPRRGGFFSSKRKAEQEVEEASLEASVRKERLQLEITRADDDDRRFEERWNIEMPARLSLRLDHGVGDIEIRGAADGIEIDSGVGDVDITAVEGDIMVDLGVGKAVVRGPATAYGEAEAAGGVGNASITVRGEKVEGGGFVSHSASWTGDGRSRIELAVGVGDAVIILD
jgi:hypothetical protein